MTAPRSGSSEDNHEHSSSTSTSAVTSVVSSDGVVSESGDVAVVCRHVQKGLRLPNMRNMAPHMSFVTCSDCTQHTHTKKKGTTSTPTTTTSAAAAVPVNEKQPSSEGLEGLLVSCFLFFASAFEPFLSFLFISKTLLLSPLLMLLLLVIMTMQ